MVIILRDDEAALQRIPPESAAVLIFLREKLSPVDMKRLANIIAPKLAPGGAGYAAKSIEDVMERL